MPNSFKGRKPAKARKQPPQNRATLVIFGVHAVLAALHNPARHIVHLWVSKSGSTRLPPDLPGKIAITTVSHDKLASKVPAGATHQGLVLETLPLATPTLDDLTQNKKTLVVLDRVTDPRNLGAIIRAGGVFDVGGIVVPKRHSAPLSGTAIKAAAGAVEYVPVVRVANITQTLRNLDSQGRQLVGMDEKAPTDLAKIPLGREPLVLVFGSEGQGLRQLTKTTCHQLACIKAPANSPLLSLNVADSVAIALYATLHLNPSQ